MAVSAGLNSRQNSEFTEKDKNKIQTGEMRFLRSTLGVTGQDRLTNEAIRKTLQINSLNDTISKYRDSWLNHTTRLYQRRFQ
jgi:hypothetical protein